MSGAEPDDPYRPYLKRPCQAARLGSPSPGSACLKVPFARCPDGVARHVTAVEPDAVGPFYCLDCDELLTLKQGRRVRRHFAHRPDSNCTGETALHLYAKELLARERHLTVPGLVIRKDGLTETVCEETAHRFDTVLVEDDLGEFRPDATGMVGSAALLIEFRVTHAVDPEKHAKVVAHGQSMIEIDLARLRIGNLDAQALDKAILHDARRSWIFHRLRKAAEKRLAERIDAERAKLAAERARRGASLKHHIEKRPKPAIPDGWRDAATARVKAAGLADLLGIESYCGHWFTVPPAVWQAAVLEALILAPARQYSPGKDLTVGADFQHERRLADKLPDWFIRTDLSCYRAERLAEAGYDRNSFGSPHDAVWYYLSNLVPHGRVVNWDKGRECFTVDRDLHGLVHRREELRGRVTGLFESAGVDDAGRHYERWASTFRVDGRPPALLAEAGGKAYDALIARLTDLRTMANGYSPLVVDDLCGLPLEAVRDGVIAKVAAEDARRAAELAKACAARAGYLEADARECLEDDADEWLARIVRETGQTVSVWASQSDTQLSHATRWLAKASADRQRSIELKRDTQARRDALTVAANKAFPDRVRADLFLKTAQPRLDGKRPIDCCDSQPAFNSVLSLLPRR